MQPKEESKSYLVCSPMIVDNEGLNIRSLRVSINENGPGTEDHKFKSKQYALISSQ